MTGILALPDEVLLQSFKSCDVVSICQLQQTCQFFNTLAKDQSLWLVLCQQAFPGLEFRNGGKDPEDQKLAHNMN